MDGDPCVVGRLGAELGRWGLVSKGRILDGLEAGEAEVVKAWVAAVVLKAVVAVVAVTAVGSHCCDQMVVEGLTVLLVVWEVLVQEDALAVLVTSVA